MRSPRSRVISRQPNSSRARLLVRRRLLPLHSVLPGLRYLAVTSLLIAVIGGCLRWLTAPGQVEALEFTSHIVGVETSAVGVLGMVGFDVDGDGDQDVVTAGSDGIKVYANTGGYKFTAVVVDDTR